MSVTALLEEAVARAGMAPADVPFTANLELLVGPCRLTGSLSETGLTPAQGGAGRRA